MSVEPEKSLELDCGSSGDSSISPQNSEFKYPKAKHIIVLTMLYINMASLGGLTTISIVLLLNEQGTVPYLALSVFYLLKFPLFLKGVLGALMDSFYVKKMGKCKFTLILSELVMSGICGVYAIYFKTWIENTELLALYLTLTAFSFALAYNDVAIDVYCLHILPKKDRAYGGACQGIGIFTGILIGVSFFTNITSPRFASEFYEQPQTEGLMSYSTYFWLSSAYMVLLSFFIWFGMPETINASQLNMEPKKDTVQVIVSFKYFFLNPNLRKLAFLLMSYIWFNSLWIYGGPIIIQRAGFPKEKLTLYDAFIVPIKVVVFMLVGAACKRYEPLKLTLYCLIAGAAQNIVGLFCYFYLKATGEVTLLVYILYGVTYLLAALYHSHIITTTAYAMKICHDESRAGVFLGGFNSLFQGSRIVSSFIFVLLLDFLSFAPLQVVVDILFIAYVFIYYKVFKNLKDLKPENFNLGPPARESELQNLDPMGVNSTVEGSSRESQGDLCSAE